MNKCFDGNDKPIKMVFTDRFDIETLPNNLLVM